MFCVHRNAACEQAVAVGSQAGLAYPSILLDA